jgi:hypothetical protein
MQILIDYQGRHIRLTDERLAHILEHPEMARMETEIQKVLLRPHVVKLSRTDGSVHLYYQHQTETLVGSKWLCVVVKLLPEDAFIMTAYLTDKLKQGEQQWPKP